MQRLMHSCQYVVNKILLLTYDSQCAIWYRKVSVDHVMNGSQKQQHKWLTVACLRFYVADHKILCIFISSLSYVACKQINVK